MAIKTVARLNWYLREVIPLFVLGTAALFLLDELGALAVIARAGEPLVTGWLGLPREMSNAFLVGFMRRDFGADYLLEAATGPAAVLSPHQILVSMVTIRSNALAVFGLVPGSEVVLLQCRPSYVLQVGETVLALEEAVAASIVVRAMAGEAPVTTPPAPEALPPLAP